MRRAGWTVHGALVGALFIASACGPSPSPVLERSGPIAPVPLEGASGADLARFDRGRARFTEIKRARDGLGPFYDGTHCSACHASPTVGGAGDQRIRHVGTILSDGTFVAPPGGTLIAFFSIHADIGRPEIPSGVNATGFRKPPPLYGDGLLEAVPDSELRALAEAPKPYGIRGRVAEVTEPGESTTRVGRFGWKAIHASLEAMCGQAYLDEMGITNRLYPAERVPNGDPRLLARLDTILDPEGYVGDLQSLAGFVRLLAPPAPRSDDAAFEQGKAVFESVGCAVCHVPALTTGPSDDPLFDSRKVPAYTDLLLHDVGTGDGIPEGDATGAEYRTPALWGLGTRKHFLHDGRASTIAEALSDHGGEATEVVARFRALSASDRAALLRFLGDL